MSFLGKSCLAGEDLQVYQALTLSEWKTVGLLKRRFNVQIV